MYCALVYFLKVQKYHCSVKNNLRSSAGRLRPRGGAGGRELRGRQQRQHPRHAQEGRQEGHHREAAVTQGQHQGQGGGHTDPQRV